MTLAAKVQAINTLNNLSFELHEQINVILRNYISRKVVKTTPYDSFVKKLNDDLNEIQKQNRIIFYFYNNSISVELTYSYAISDQRSDYVKCNFSVATIEDGVLRSLKTPVKNDNYILEDVQAAFDKIRQLEEEKYKIKAEIYQFT